MDNILFTVGANAPEWLQAIGQTITKHHADTTGAILYLIKEESIVSDISRTTVNDALDVIESLCEFVREHVPNEVADALIKAATKAG